jgi:hypothetical protein
MNLTGARRMFLAAAVLACGELGSVEWPKDDGLSPSLIRDGVVISVFTARAGEASGLARRATCTLVRYYVARYSAPATEAWARSRGATGAEIETARRCIRTALSA